MPADPYLIEQSAVLKRDLLNFIQKPRYAREVGRVLYERFGDERPGETDTINTLDYLVLEHRMPNGRMLIDDYLKAHPKLPAAEREMLLGWKGVIETVFRVERLDGDALIGENLVDGLTYRVITNAGPALFKLMPPGSFATLRLTPLQDEWLISGATQLYKKSDSRRVLAMARRLQMTRPELMFRNPEKLELAWRLQRQDRDAFIRFFGSDTLVLSRAEFVEHYKAYLRFKAQEIRDAQETAPASPVGRRQRAAADLAMVDSVDAMLPPGPETFGVIYDAVEGFCLFADFDQFEAAYANPELVASGPQRKIVRSYLKDDSISPLPFRRMAERYPEGADRLFQTLLRKPGFVWQRDGEELLRRHKSSYFDTPPLPTVIPITEADNADNDNGHGGLLSQLQDALRGGA